MSTQFYLKSGRCFPNMQTQNNVRGCFVHTSDDPWSDPDFKPRDDLLAVVAWISCRIMVENAAYLLERIDDREECIDDGEYTCGDTETRITLERKEWRRDGKDELKIVWRRPINIVAPTWEKVKAAIQKIKHAEIIHCDKKETALQVLEQENEELHYDVEQLKQSLKEASGREDTLRVVYTHIRGLCNSVPAPNHEDVSTLQFVLVVREVEEAIKNSNELAAIKATRWYKFGAAIKKFFTWRPIISATN